MAAFPWTDQLDQQLRDLAATGTSVRAMAEKIGCSKSVVDRRLKHLGITLDRTSTAAATAANALDAKARRATLQLALLEDAEKLRAQIWQETGYAQAVGGMDPTVLRWSMDEPIPADKLKLMQATGVAIDRALKLDLHDSGTGQAQVVGLLQATAAALGITDAQDTQP